MSEITAKNRGLKLSQLPPAVRGLFAALRSHVRVYSVAAGVLFVVSLAVAVFWLTSGIDAGWFALQRLELPVGIRFMMSIAMLTGGCWLLFQHVVRPLVRRTNDTELAKLLERKFPEFQDGLMTIVEGRDGYPDRGSLVDSMLRRTAANTDRTAGLVSLNNVFDLAPLRKRAWIAGLLVLSLAGNAVARPGSLRRWWSAFALCEQAYHLRTTDVEATVIVQPGNRRVKFTDVNGEQVYLHPRGADLELELLVPDGNSETGKPWVVPERIRVDVIRADGSRSRAYVSSTSGHIFRFILTRLQESVQLEVLAGDYRTPQPWRVEAVTPPAVDTINVECTYPEYTGWNRSAETNVQVLGSEVSLPTGTQFELRIDCNKPLQAVRIATDYFDLEGDQATASLHPRDGYPGRLSDDEPLLSEDGRTISARFWLSSNESAGDMQSGSTSAAGYLAVPSNTSLRFFLHDVDDVMSVAPESLRIRGIADKAPVVAVRTIGVSNSVTRLAKIPFAGLIRDDYGVMKAGFQFLVDDRTDWSPRSFENRFSSGLEYDLEAAGGPGSEFFSVQRGDLTEGQTLAVSIVATDNCDIPKANTTRSEPVVFRIVSSEELRSLLYTREISLRSRFEEILQKLEDVRTDLQFHVDVARRFELATNSAAPGERSEDAIAITTCATRSGRQLRRQNDELDSIAEGFDEIIQELINNAIPPKDQADDMRDDIVLPLQNVISKLMAEADRSVSRFRVSALAGDRSSELIKVASGDVSTVISELRLILERVRDAAELHEIMRNLKDLIEEQDRVSRETKREQIRRLGF